MSTNQILLGVALTLVLAVGARVAAARLHLPALILLLPTGFVAGALTDVVDPVRLLGPAFQPLPPVAHRLGVTATAGVPPRPHG